MAVRRSLDAVRQGEETLCAATRGQRQATQLVRYYHTPPAAGRVGGAWRLMHSGKAALTAHPKITTHPSIISRENDPRWEGELTIGSDVWLGHSL